MTPSRPSRSPGDPTMSLPSLAHDHDRAMAAAGCGRPTLPAAARIHATIWHGIAAGGAGGALDVKSAVAASRFASGVADATANEAGCGGSIEAGSTPAGSGHREATTDGALSPETLSSWFCSASFG